MDEFHLHSDVIVLSLSLSLSPSPRNRCHAPAEGMKASNQRKHTQVQEIWQSSTGIVNRGLLRQMLQRARTGVCAHCDGPLWRQFTVHITALCCVSKHRQGRTVEMKEKYIKKL